MCRSFRVCTPVWFATALGLASAVAQQPFSEQAAQRGLSYMVPGGWTQFGCGVALLDLDNDGDADAVITGRGDGVVGVYENDGTGHFIDRSTGSGIAAMPMASSVSAADYDDDGDLDLFISNFFEPDRLLRNEGNFVFTDVTTAAGVGDDGPAMAAVWGDYDNDGWIDLYVCVRTLTDGHPSRNKLYHNLGNGTFQDVGDALGVTDGDAPTLVATWFDYDRDGDADLYLGNDKGSGHLWSNRLYENLGGTFADVTDVSGTHAWVDCMGIAVGDFYGNGWQDLYVTNTPAGNVLLTNLGDGTFRDDSADAGVESFAVGWAALFFDFDHDQRLDLFVCDMAAPDRLYRGGVWPCPDLAPSLGLADPADSFCCAAADVDLDGDLDLMVSGAGKPVKLYINNEGQLHHWVRFKVIGRGQNRFAVGANVELTAGGFSQLREVFGGGNFKSQNEHVLHFGLGDTTTMIDQITVVWPGGTTRTLHDYPADRTWTLYPPERLGDGDGDGDVDLLDYFAARRCMTGPGPGNLEPGCEVFDVDGDGDVDWVDLAAMRPAPPGLPKRVIWP